MMQDFFIRETWNHAFYNREIPKLEFHSTPDRFEITGRNQHATLPICYPNGPIIPCLIPVEGPSNRQSLFHMEYSFSCDRICYRALRKILEQRDLHVKLVVCV